MTTLVARGIKMFDIRTTIKAEAGEAITMGHSVWVDTSGKAWNIDEIKYDIVHGWALTTVAQGDMLTIVTTCRMEVETTQTIGNKVYTGAESGGSAPSTTLATDGICCGFAYAANMVFLFVPIPAQNGGAHT